MRPDRRRIPGVVAGVGIIISTAVIIFAKWANSPTSSSGVSVLPAAVEGESITIGTKPLQSTHFATKVPANFQVKSTTEQPQGPVYTQLLLAGPSSAPGSRIADQLAVTVGLLPKDGLQGVSAVMLRTRTPETYSVAQFSWLTPQARAFTKIRAEAESGIYFTDGQKYAAVVLSGGSDRLEQFEIILQRIFADWVWE